MKMIATACAPCVDAAACAAARTSSSSTAVRIVPSASVRSSTSSRMSRSAIGVKSPHRPQVRRRSRRRISSTSRKPRVVMTPIFGAAPLQQRVGADRGAVHDRAARGTPPSARSPLRKPCASSPRREGTFAVVKVRAVESKRNRSVNVPPTSMPTMQRSCAVDLVVALSRRLARHVAEPHVARDALRDRASPDRRSRRRPAFRAAPSGRA